MGTATGSSTVHGGRHTDGDHRMNLPDQGRADSPFEHFRELGRRDARFDPERNRAVNRVIAQVRALARKPAA
jgi:hypothetical protein